METERIVIDLDKICRACMTEEGEMTSVFNRTDVDGISIVDMLVSCSSVQVSEFVWKCFWIKCLFFLVDRGRRWFTDADLYHLLRIDTPSV